MWLNEAIKVGSQSSRIGGFIRKGGEVCPSTLRKGHVRTAQGGRLRTGGEPARGPTVPAPRGQAPAAQALTTYSVAVQYGGLSRLRRFLFKSY